MKKYYSKYGSDTFESVTSIRQCISDIEKLQKKIESLPSEEGIDVFLEVCREIECQSNDNPVIEKELVAIT